MRIWSFSVDTGGTFTDCLGCSPSGAVHRAKVLSRSALRGEIIASENSGFRVSGLSSLPKDFLRDYAVSVEGQELGVVTASHAAGEDLEIELKSSGISLSKGNLVEFKSPEEAPILGLRVILGLRLDEKLPPLRLRVGTTRGTNALLEDKGAPVILVVSSGFRDLLRIRNQKRPDLFGRGEWKSIEEPWYTLEVEGRLDSDGNEVVPLKMEPLFEQLASALDELKTEPVVTISLLHSYRENRHEETLAKAIQKRFGLRTVTSSSVAPSIHYLNRMETARINATLTPVMDAYLDAIESPLTSDSHLSVMKSTGGLASRQHFRPVDSLLSGPAGGVAGAILAGRRLGWKRLLALDMGGTSTDVSRWAGTPLLQSSHRVGSATVAAPALRIETIAAGGGSLCFVEDGRLRVGPESAGAFPGPASYGMGGPLALTDIHLLLGRVDPEAFQIPLRLEAAQKALEDATRQAGESDWRIVAEGFLEVAHERMAQAIRTVSIQDGEDPAKYGLVAFGGAGGLHACGVARRLGIQRVVLPREAGLLSAEGLQAATLEAVEEVSLLSPLSDVEESLEHEFEDLERRARTVLESDHLEPTQLASPQCWTLLRLRGQESVLEIPWTPEVNLSEAFALEFERVFGFSPPPLPLELVRLRLRLAQKTEPVELEPFAPEESAISAKVRKTYDRRKLVSGEVVAGPAIIWDPYATLYLEEGWKASKGEEGSLVCHQTKTCEGNSTLTPEDSLGKTRIDEEILLNRLEILVDESGLQLERTALSTNIRERLDFSCGLLNARGQLLVNAPHIPVHLGALGTCVRSAAKEFTWEPGDVLVTNHPGFGGSHLPDVTVISGLFSPEGELLGYLANRAHHAEIGGKKPGSMPPDATNLEEEGVVIAPQWLIRKGKDRFREIEQLLRDGPYPSRMVEDNLADLRAQMASLHRGEQLFRDLLASFGQRAVLTGMDRIYASGREAMDRRLNAGGALVFSVEEKLDDGHRIAIEGKQGNGRLHISFAGTDGPHPGNLNATPAIVQSALLYALRLWVDTPIPLNEGLLESVDLDLPSCFLNPTFPPEVDLCPAVVGGNVETSQRIVDALLRGLNIMASSQGTMNNLLFGDKTFGYYETIGGGGGAGPNFAGASGAHVHMTNTAITDPEILEHRYPVRVWEFGLRKNSGGAGRWTGGDGLVREIEWLRPLSVSLLTQRRTIGAPGAEGGASGKPGKQTWIYADGTQKILPSIAQMQAQPGDRLKLETPGGGGWGKW